MKETPELLIAHVQGRVSSVPGLAAVGMKAGVIMKVPADAFIPLPAASRLFLLPKRFPVGFDAVSGKLITLKGSQYAAAAFLPPGYTVTHSAAYVECRAAPLLPLFSYAAAGFYNGAYYAAAVKVDSDPRHDPCGIDVGEVKRRVPSFKKLFPRNRLIPHLVDCALIHGCPNAQNLFLSRYEAPLPVSPSCNAACAGCISYQRSKKCPPTQPRITFVPSPEEIAEIALFHIKNAKDALVSFGQGCEGEPLLQADIIERAITLIREETARGTININTNGSRPMALARLFDAGLDSVRVSLNSARKEYYDRYYRPRGYSFKDVVRSVQVAKKKGGWVSLNYLTMPGFTDSPGEYEALKEYIAKNHPDMIQWRNLNYDPLEYFRIVKTPEKSAAMFGVSEIIRSIGKEFPTLRSGYFNPSKRGRISQ